MGIDADAVAADLGDALKPKRVRLSEDPAFVERAARAVILCEKIAHGWKGVGSKTWEAIDERTRRSLCDEVASYLRGDAAPFMDVNVFAAQVVDEAVRDVLGREEAKARRAEERRRESTPYSRARARHRLAAMCAQAAAGKHGGGGA